MTEFRIARDSDYEALIRFSNQVFAPEEQTNNERNDVSPDSYFPRILPKLYQNRATAPCHHLAVENGGIVGCVGLFPLPMNVAGTALHVYGIGTVGVSEKHRGEGLMIRLMDDAIRTAKDAGADFLLLSGLRQRYGHFGFELAGQNPVFTFTSTNARQLYGRDAAFGYEFVRIPDGDRTAAAWVHRERMQSPCRVEIGEEEEIRQMRSMAATPFAVLKDGKLCGTFLYRETMWRAMCDFAPADPGEAGHILSDFLRFDRKGENEITIERTPPYRQALLSELSRIAEDCDIRHMENIRIFRYARVLGAYLSLKASYSPLCDGELTVLFDSGENLLLRVANGVPSVTPTEQTPDLELTGPEAVNLMFGHMTALSAFSYALSAPVRSWFPLPYHLRAADMV